MTELRRLAGTAFAQYLTNSAANYADDNVKAGRWPSDGAYERAVAELAKSLPDGADTPDNYIFEIITRPDKQPVGYVWFRILDNYSHRSAFIYDLEVKPDYRRQGYATEALKLVENFVRELGITSLGLHVFAFNDGARRLYEKLGYFATGMNLQKQVEG